ncbi:MAG: DUF547 domain-containing protein [Acidiferrobacterales bacterium]|nr:DUF547 domain-containing protein [Acidiferrobacterales bacterium]
MQQKLSYGVDALGDDHRSLRIGTSSNLFGFLFLALVFFAQMAQAAPKAKLLEFWDESEERSLFDVDHSPWDNILAKYVTNHDSGVNRFAYERVSKEDKAKLKKYLETAQLMDPRQLTRARQKAFWLNLYNAGVTMQIIESAPKKSIKEIGNARLWRKKRFKIAMQKLSLDDIEHGIIRPIYKDPRVHFAFTSGTVGSANILHTAFTDKNVEELLDFNTKAFLNHDRGVKYENGTLVLSTIFKWYQDDFGGDINGVKQFLNQHLLPEKLAGLNSSKGTSYDYDWSLNKGEELRVASN